MSFEIAARAILGKRSSQQDAWRVINDRGADLKQEAEANAVQVGDRALVIVADGVGGYAGGEEASNLACNAFVATFLKAQGSIDSRLREALNTANAAIGDEQRRQPDKRDMSTTFIGIYLDGGKMTFVSVGDSLLLRYRDEEIHRVNLDHSYADVLDRRLLGTGSKDPREWSVAINDDQRAAITLALSGGQLDRAEYGHAPQIATRPLLPGDVIIAASDGIETIEMVQLQNFVRQLEPTGAGGIAEGLIRAADGIGPNRRREPDNTTIVIIRVPGSAKPAVAAAAAPTVAKTAASAVANTGSAAAAPTALGRTPVASTATDAETPPSATRASKFSPAMVFGALAAVALLISAGLFLLVSRLPQQRAAPSPAPPTTTAPTPPTPATEAPKEPVPATEDPISPSTAPAPENAPKASGKPKLAPGEPPKVSAAPKKEGPVACSEQEGGSCK